MKRYAVITKVEVYSGVDIIGTVEYADGLGFKAKLADAFMGEEDICFVGKVLTHLVKDGDLDIEEGIDDAV